MPIYKSTHTIPDAGTKPGAKQTRLIEAANTAAAMRFAARDWITIEVCTTSEAIALGAQGVTLEKAE